MQKSSITTNFRPFLFHQGFSNYFELHKKAAKNTETDFGVLGFVILNFFTCTNKIIFSPTKEQFVCMLLLNHECYYIKYFQVKPFLQPFFSYKKKTTEMEFTNWVVLT
jgi:hypothetical protein